MTLCVLEDNQATILVVRKGYSPKLRHITRTHKINLSGLSEVFQEDSAELDYCKTNDQAADIFTKSLPSQKKWGPALKVPGIRTDLANELKGLDGRGSANAPHVAVDSVAPISGTG